MRILVVADIHANWTALSAIDEKFDACLFLGDLVDYCTEPIPCIDWVRQNASASVRGNHDHAVAQRIPGRRANGLGGLATVTRQVQWDMLKPAHTKFLARLPVTRRITLDGTVFFLVHATPRDPLDEYLRDDPKAWSERLGLIGADFVCVGHTHIPYCMEVDGVTVLNPGSVGQPRDGDPRCSYAIIENGRVEIRRVEYDIDQTVRQMHDCGVDDEMLGLAARFLRAGGQIDDSEMPEAANGWDSVPAD